GHEVVVVRVVEIDESSLTLHNAGSSLMVEVIDTGKQHLMHSPIGFNQRTWARRDVLKQKIELNVGQPRESSLIQIDRPNGLEKHTPERNLFEAAAMATIRGGRQQLAMIDDIPTK